jgi:hypothetical protein
MGVLQLVAAALSEERQQLAVTKNFPIFSEPIAHGVF